MINVFLVIFSFFPFLFKILSNLFLARKLETIYQHFLIYLITFLLHVIYFKVY
jgi:hypothetical protein